MGVGFKATHKYRLYDPYNPPLMISMSEKINDKLMSFTIDG